MVFLTPATLRCDRARAWHYRSRETPQGFGDLAEVAAVDLETVGNFSVIPKDKAVKRSAFP
ncbi:MAG: hypothetical protein ABI810_06035 [Sphingomonas bacterium]